MTAQDGSELLVQRRVDQLFKNLSAWRHLPAYQLERRADVFFSLYLREVVQAVLPEVSLHTEIIPEFPIPTRLLSRGGTRRPVRIDYALFAADLATVFFVELKTDNRSRDPDQDQALADLRDNLRFRTVVVGILDILATQEDPEYRHKYYHLISALERLAFVTGVPTDLERYLYETPRQGLTARLQSIHVTERDPDVRIIYVQPSKETHPDPSVTYIDFDQFARLVEQHRDGLSQVFAASLRRWAAELPGARPARRG